MIFIKPSRNNWLCCIIQQVNYNTLGERESEESKCEESENKERESEEGDESEFEPLVKKPCSTRSGRRRHASSIIVQFCNEILLK